MASSHSRTWHSSTGWGIRSPRLPSPATRPTGSASSQASTCCGPKPGPRPTNVPARRRWQVPCGRERDRPARPQRGRHGEGGRRLPAPLEAHRFRNQPQGGIWDAPRPDLPSDSYRAECRHCRARDAGRRHAAPRCRSRRATRPSDNAATPPAWTLLCSNHWCPATSLTATTT